LAYLARADGALPLEQEGKGDPLDKYCGDNPEADECRCAPAALLCGPRQRPCCAPAGGSLAATVRACVTQRRVRRVYED